MSTTTTAPVTTYYRHICRIWAQAQSVLNGPHATATATICHMDGDWGYITVSTPTATADLHWSDIVPLDELKDTLGYLAKDLSVTLTYSPR